MEVEIKPISLDARLEYLQEISKTQKANAQKFPWPVAVVAFLCGAGIVYGVYKYRSKKQKMSNS